MFFILSMVFLVSLTGDSFAGKLSGKIRIDGSSTVFPITEAVAEEFQKKYRKVRVTVGISGTGGGFKKFTTGQTDINDASRPIKNSEKEKAVKNEIGYMVLPVAYDGLSVVINPDNDFVDHLTTTELRKIWQPQSTVKKWSDVRPEWPDKQITLYGPGVDSGTFDYFTDVINGEEGKTRADYTPSEDDNVLVMGVSGDKGSIGYFGYAYYIENESQLKLLSVDGGTGCVAPSEQTINDSSYAPLARPMYIYVNNAELSKPEVYEFVKFYLDNGKMLSEEGGYVALPEANYNESLSVIAEYK